MKKVIIGLAIFAIGALVLIGGIILFITKGVTDINSAIEFNDAIVKEQTNFTNEFVKFDTKLATASDEELDKQYNEIKESVSESLKTIQDLDAPAGGENFKKAAEDLFKFYEDFLKEEYDEIIKIAKKDLTQRTQDDLNKIQKINEDFAKEEQEIIKTLNEEQQNFSKDKGFEIDPNKKL